MSNIFSRNSLLYGQDFADKLTNAKIAICGVGAVGSVVAEALARLGVGTFFLFDFDEVEESNINRQLCALHSTIGKKKVDVVSERILDINPNSNVLKFPQFLDSSNMENLFSLNPDVIVDAIDSIDSKAELICQSAQRNLKIVSSMGAARKLDTEQIFISDILSTKVCPLASRMRKELRSKGIDKKIPCVFSTEPALKDSHTISSDKKIIGSSVLITAIFGLKLANLAIHEL